MALISRTTIDEINSRMDALVIIGDYVRLDQKSGRWWGLCPFHNEKTPSFTVNPDLKSYYCFGCQKGGSVLNFVMEMDKLTFPEAVEQLADRMNIEIKYDGSNGQNISEKNNDIGKKEALFELYRRMAGTFHHLLLKNAESEPVIRYITDRGLSSQMIEKFHLGYAPMDRTWMYKFLMQKGYSVDFLAQSGLFSARHAGLPLFHGRLMFPIYDRQGRVIAFGGRFIEGLTENSGISDAPKYINSPELEIYKKGETLFAIDQALPQIRKTRTVHLAEGYMDVIALHQAGITNSAASLGIAFTDEQAKLLKRWAEKVILVFDSDEAGKKAAEKGILTCRKNGLACAVVVPQSGDSSPGQEGTKDPSDILRLYGPEVLQKKLKSYINDFDFLVNRAQSLYDTRDSGGKSLAIAFLFPYMQILESEVSRDACMETAAAVIGTTKTAILNDWRQYNNRQANHRTINLTPAKTTAPIRINDELSLLMTVAVNDYGGQGAPFYSEFRKKLAIRDIEDPYAKELFIALEECFANNETGLDYFLSRISSPELRKFYLEKGTSGEFSVHTDRILADGIKKAEQKKLEKELDSIVLKLKTLKMNSGNSQEAEKLLADKIHIDEKLRKLKEECQ